MLCKRLKQIIRQSSGDTWTGSPGWERSEREKDFSHITKVEGKALLIGTSDSEMRLWAEMFGQPTGISLEGKWEEPIIQMDMHDTTFKTGEFNFIYCSQTLEHSPAPILALLEIARILKSGGKYFFWMPQDIDNQNQPYHYSCFPPYIWLSLLEKANLINEQLYSHGFSCGYSGYKK